MIYFKNMNIYHSYFRFWRNFQNKIDYCWVAITKTVPQDYIGSIYRRLAPIGENFDRVCEPFNEKAFFIEYAKLLHSLDKKEIRKEIESFSKHGKDIVLLNWEDLERKSEGRFAYAWMNGMTIEEADRFDLQNVLDKKKREEDLIYGSRFLTL